MHATSWRSDALRHHLTPTWSVELPDDGEGRITDDGELAITAPGRSIVLATWDSPGDVTPQEVLADLRAKERPVSREEYLETGADGLLRWALLIDEDDDGARYQGLYGYVLADTEWLQVAVLFEHTQDLTEALHIWRSVRHLGSDDDVDDAASDA